MATGRTSLLNLPLPTEGELDGSWGDMVNKGLTEYLDIAIAGVDSLTSANFTAGALTLANTTGTDLATNIAATSAQYATLRVSSLVTNSTITAPSSSRSYRIINADATYSLTIKASGQTGVTFSAGQTGIVAYNGTDYALVGTIGPTVPVARGGTGATTLTGVLKGNGTSPFTASNVSLSSEVTGTLPAANGGTGQSTYTVGDILYASTTTALSKLADVATGNALISGGVGVAPSWGKVGLTTHVSGTLPIANGGTNTTATPTNGGVAYGTGSAVAYTAAGTSGQFLQSNGSAAPTWVSSPTPSAATPSALGTVYARTSTTNTQPVSLGYNAGASFAAGGNFNTFIGYTSGTATNSGYSNTAVGFNSLGANTTGYYNVAIGRSAQETSTTAYQNIAIGYYAIQLGTGNRNIAIGTQALQNVTGAANIAIGDATAQGLTSANGVIAIGASAVSSATTSNYLVGVGGGALAGNTSGLENVAVGYNAGYANTTGSYNTAFGSYAQYSGGSNGYNTSVGHSALRFSGTSQSNVAIGYEALYNATNPLGQTAVGFYALRGLTTGTINCAVGYYALRSNTTGSSNTANGYNALQANISGSNNSAFGAEALRANTTGSTNTAIGNNALYTATDSGNNTAVGASALYTLGTVSYDNTALGREALSQQTSGSANTAVGSQALGGLTTGQNNTAIGRLSGYSGTNDITTGSNNILIGYNAQATSSTVSNQITLGNASISSLRCAVTTITSLSDARDKKNVADLQAGLDFVNRLRPVTFDWNCRDGSKVDVPDSGFIAQDLKQVQQDTGVTIEGLVYESDPDRLEAGYGKLLPVLVKAIQELSSEVEFLKAQLKGN